MEQAQHPGEDPGRLSFAEGVVQVETDFHAVAQRQRLEVPDGDAVLQHHRRMIRAQRQPLAGRHAAQEHLDTPARLGPQHRAGIPERESVQLPLARRRSRQGHVQKGLPGFFAQALAGERLRGKLVIERNLRAPVQRTVMVERLAEGTAHGGP